MTAANDLRSLSPYPTVDLNEIAPPVDGLLLGAPDGCARHFNGGRGCQEHYLRLRDPRLHGQLVQCPLGFASFGFTTGRAKLAFTGLIPHPRLGGEAEKSNAKRHPRHRLSSESVRDASLALAKAGRQLEVLEGEALKKHSVALHELRKLNRSVKQTAERLCREASPRDPDAADASLVRIWKTADLMSHQFDVVELLANEQLAALPLNSVIEIYKLFDKCVRIYRPPNEPRRIVITAPNGYSPRISCCDKTLPIIPTVLVENALRYSIRDTEVSVSFRPDGELCLVEVSNLTAPNSGLTERVFERGVRVSPDSAGSGNGLYLAQLVARQHGAELRIRVDPINRERSRCTFSLSFRTV